LADSLDNLAASLIAMVDDRSGGNIERSVPKIDIGRVISSSPVRINIQGLQLTLEEEDFVTAHGYTPTVGHVVLVIPVFSGGFFVMRASA
jgi:hypothetical protein